MHIRNMIVGAVIALAMAASAPSTFAQSALVNGQVTKIDAAQGKITLRHEPIKNLDMDSMTMVFGVDPTMLKGVKVGDKVKFEADRVNGQLTVTKIQK